MKQRIELNEVDIQTIIANHFHEPSSSVTLYVHIYDRDRKKELVFPYNHMDISINAVVSREATIYQEYQDERL